MNGLVRNGIYVGPLNVGESLDLGGRTSLTSLPEGLNVGGYLYLGGCTSLTSLPNKFSCETILYIGELSGYKFNIFDGIPCVVVSTEEKDGIKVHKTYDSKFVDGVLVEKRTVYVAEKYGVYSHAETVPEAIEDLLFKVNGAYTEQYKGIDIQTPRPIPELVRMYRSITGACKFGVNQFIDEVKTKEKYSVFEVILLTKDHYGHETFKSFFTENS